MKKLYQKYQRNFKSIIPTKKVKIHYLIQKIKTKSTNKKEEKQRKIKKTREIMVKNKNKINLSRQI